MEDDNLTAVSILDTYHDFYKGGRGNHAGKWDTAWRYIEPIARSKYSQTVINLLDRHFQKPEDGAEIISQSRMSSERYSCKKSRDPAENLRNLTIIFELLDLTISSDPTAPLIRIICDMGVGNLKMIADNIPGYINIVNVVTPATACDSAGLSRGDVFNKPILFKDGNTVVPLLSTATTLSGSRIYETSNVFDRNVEPQAILHINEGGIDKDITIVGGSGPSVNDLLATIMKDPSYKQVYPQLSSIEIQLFLT